MQKNIVEEKSVNMCRENLIIKENSSLSSHGLKLRGFSRSLLDKRMKDIITEKFSLFCGDCIEIMKSLPEHSVDCVICDLQYGITQCDWDKIISFDKLLE